MNKPLIYVGTYKYNDKEFTIHYEVPEGYTEEDAIYMFTQGNYSCDCSISSFIRQEYGEDAIPNMDCGYEIEFINYHFEHKD